MWTKHDKLGQFFNQTKLNVGVEAGGYENWT